MTGVGTPWRGIRVLCMVSTGQTVAGRHLLQRDRRRPPRGAGTASGVHSLPDAVADTRDSHRELRTGSRAFSQGGSADPDCQSDLA